MGRRPDAVHGLRADELGGEDVAPGPGVRRSDEDPVDPGVGLERGCDEWVAAVPGPPRLEGPGVCPGVKQHHAGDRRVAFPTRQRISSASGGALKSPMRTGRMPS